MSLMSLQAMRVGGHVSKLIPVETTAGLSCARQSLTEIISWNFVTKGREERKNSPVQNVREFFRCVGLLSLAAVLSLCLALLSHNATWNPIFLPRYFPHQAGCSHWGNNKPFNQVLNVQLPNFEHDNLPKHTNINMRRLCSGYSSCEINALLTILALQSSYQWADERSLKQSAPISARCYAPRNHIHRCRRNRT